MSLFNFGKKATAEPSALTGLNNPEFKLKMLELRVAGLEQAILDLCVGIRMHIDRIDHNTAMLDKNLHNVAAMTIRPPKDLLGGTQEPN